jgi:hypothetical protein
MKTITAGTTTLFAFNHPAPELLEEMPADYYRECQIARCRQCRGSAGRRHHRDHRGDPLLAC